MVVIFRDSFSKDVDKLKDKNLRRKIEAVIKELDKADSLIEVRNLKKLKGYKNHYRIRIGDYRLGIYQDGFTVELAHFLHRKDIYTYFP